MKLKIQSEDSTYKLYGSISIFLFLLTSLSVLAAYYSEKEINTFAVLVPLTVILICVMIIIIHYFNRYHSASCDENSIKFKSGNKEHQVYWNNITNIYYSSKKRAYLIEALEFSDTNMFWIYDNPKISAILNNHHEPIKSIDKAYSGT